MCIRDRRCKATCPVHALGKFCAEAESGQPFAHFRPYVVLTALRAALQELGAPQHHAHRTHDLRGRHAQDIAARGSRLADILRTGGWRHAAFLSHLNKDELEVAAIREAHGDLSSSEDDEG
eukprot:6697057-Pyramimonas_sp.AAC.1